MISIESTDIKEIYCAIKSPVAIYLKTKYCGGIEKPSAMIAVTKLVCNICCDVIIIEEEDLLFFKLRFTEDIKYVVINPDVNLRLCHRE